MSLEVTFLPASEEDFEEILLMMRDLCSMYGSEFNAGLVEKNLHKFAKDESLGRLWKISNNNKIAGYIVLAFGFSFEYGGRDAFIDELYLKEEFRGQKTGIKIMEFIEKHAKELGVNTLHLEVDTDNEAGKRLYYKSGFGTKGRTLLSKSLLNNAGKE